MIMAGCTPSRAFARPAHTETTLPSPGRCSSLRRSAGSAIRFSEKVLQGMSRKREPFGRKRELRQNSPQRHRDTDEDDIEWYQGTGSALTFNHSLLSNSVSLCLCDEFSSPSQFHAFALALFRASLRDVGRVSSPRSAGDQYGAWCVTEDAAGDAAEKEAI